MSRAARLVYRALLRLVPAAMREAHGAEMEALFLAELDDARERGLLASLAAWRGALADVAHRAPYEHWRRRGRDTRREDTMHAFWSDLRFAARSFARQKGATALVLFTLTLAVAANTAVFALLDGVFFRPFPFPEPGRLAYLNERAPSWNLEFTGINYPDFVRWRRATRSFRAMALYEETSVNLADASGAERVRGLYATREMPEVLGVRPILGRGFTADEDRPDGPSVVIIGYGLWQTRFTGARDVVGRTLRINSRPHTIVGVLPREADFPGGVELWVPYGGDPNQPYESYSGDGIARLRPGVTVAQARADLLAAHQAIWRQRDTSHVVTPRIDALRDHFVSDFRVMGQAMGAGVVLVLLIACANVAGAMLARATFRQRELAIRKALGASASRLARQMLSEALVLASLAGVLGIALGWWGLRLLLLSAPDRFPRWVRLDVDARMVAFSVLVVGATTILFGVVPALSAHRQDAREALSSGSPRSSASRTQRRMLDALVVVEIALAAVLLVAGGLLTRAFAHLRDVDPGFRADGVATFRIALPRAKYAGGQAQRAFFETLIERVRALPGVTAAGAITCPPLGCHQGNFFEAEGGTPRTSNGVDPVTLTLTATPGAFAALGVQLAHGRNFAEHEGRPHGFTPVVVNESFARRMWPGVADPTGRRIRFRGDTADRWMSVVGVEKDVKHYGLDQPPRPTVYFNTTRMDSTTEIPSFTLLARTTGDPSSLFAPMRAIVRAMDPELPLFEVKTLRDAVDASLAVRRTLSLALGAFAAIALTLAVGGVYAVLSYLVGRRRREIGIRMALGARRAQVVGLVVRQGVGLVAAGLVIGLPLSLAAARILSSLLVGVSASDPLTYAAAAVTLVITVVVAALGPARRAATVDPSTTMTAE